MASVKYEGRPDRAVTASPLHPDDLELVRHAIATPDP
jgi:hypothetical protein